MNRKLSVFALVLGCISVAQASTTRTVNNDSTNTAYACSHATNSSIQAAITASASGDTVNVCPGTYAEALDITKPITITGIESNEKHQIILLPTTGAATTELFNSKPTSAVILVDGVNKVYLNNLIADGASASTDLNAEDCTVNNVGIYYRNASGAINNSVVRNIGLRSGGVLTGCQEGIGIYAESGNGGATNLSVLGTSIHDYDKEGIEADESGTTLTAKGDTVTGAGPTAITAQNGIQLAYGARGVLNSNTVADNNYSPCTSVQNCSFSASNILVYQAADYAEAESNILTDSNLSLYFQANHGSVKYNVVAKDIAFDGIDLVGNYNTADNNSIVRSDNDAIYICGSHNAAHYNNINDAAFGVYEDTGACSASGSNSGTSNTMNNVGLEVFPNNGSVPEVHSALNAVSRTPSPSVRR